MLYQELVGSGRYSVYSTAIMIPRFLIVVHIAVLNGCWQRVPVSVCEQDDEFTSSSTPSLTMNSTSWGVLFEAPVPGFGMRLLMAVIAVSKLVSVSLLLFEQVSQLLEQTSNTSMPAAAVAAADRFDEGGLLGA